MLPEARCGAAQRPLHGRELIRRGGVRKGSCRWMRDLSEEPPRFEMLGVQDITHGRHRRKRNPSRLRLVVELVYALFSHPIFQQEFQGVPILSALQARRKNRL